MSRFITSLFFLFTLSVVAQSAPAMVMFMSASQTIATNAISETITIQAQDASGNAFKLPNTGCVSLSSSASGEFSSSSSSWSAVLVLTMNKNSANRNFYYKGNAVGTHTLTVRLVLKPESEERSCANWPVTEWPIGWTATQTMTVGSTTAVSSPSPDSEQASSTPSVTSTGAPSEPIPSLSVKVSRPATVSVGADATFSATVFGVKKEPIPNARVIWSFGNGAVKEGLSVRYGYNIPGSYVVVVDAASGGFAGAARFVVKATKPDIHISRVVSSANGFVEIENKSNTELDVSGWGIASGDKIFTIPDHTIILPSVKVAFPADVMKLLLSDNDTRLLFPNGTLAAEYVEPLVKQPPPPLPLPLDNGETPQELPRGERVVSVAPEIHIATSAAAVALSVSGDAGAPPLWVWLLGVFAACLIGVGALAAFRFRPLPQEESEEKEFAEKVHII